MVNSNNLHKFNQAYVFYCNYRRMHLVAIIFISGIHSESNILDYATQGIKKNVCTQKPILSLVNLLFYSNTFKSLPE